MDKVKIIINNTEYDVDKGMTVIQACEKFADINIPRFCYHDKLKIAGNCRMCLVEVKPGPPKPSASCATYVADGMQIFTDSEMVKNARDGVMEFILANHPLDCPVCDQAGECDLQDQAYVYGREGGSFEESKRAVEDKYMGPIIKTKMNRCIHCTRCVRFSEDVAGGTEIGILNRGEDSEVTSLGSAIRSELSGNLVDLCPVGALTSKPYKGTARDWELTKHESFDTVNSLGASIRVDTRGGMILRILPTRNDEVNEEWICDKARFSFDGAYNQRLDSAYKKKCEVFSSCDIQKTVKEAQEIVKNANKIGVICGSKVDLKTAFLLNELSKTKERVMISAFENDIMVDNSELGNVNFNAKISGIDRSDLILLVGSGIKKNHPVLNARIKSAVNKGIKVFVVGKEMELSYDAKFLGDSTEDLINISKAKSDISGDLSNAKNPLIIVSSDACEGEYGLEIFNTCLAIANKYFVKNDWNGYCFLTNNISESGILSAIPNSISNTLAVINAAKNKELDCLLLLGTSDIDTRSIDVECPIVSLSSHGDDNLIGSDILIPTKTHFEKNCIFKTCEGRIIEINKISSIVDKAIDEAEFFENLLDANSYDFEEFVKKQEIIFENSGNSISAGYLTKDKSITIPSRDINFYMTDLISRNSVNMANCVKEILLKND